MRLFCLPPQVTWLILPPVDQAPDPFSLFPWTRGVGKDRTVIYLPSEAGYLPLRDFGHAGILVQSSAYAASIPLALRQITAPG